MIRDEKKLMDKFGVSLIDILGMELIVSANYMKLCGVCVNSDIDNRKCFVSF